MELEEVEGFEWNLMDVMVSYRRQFHVLDVKIIFNDTQPEAIAAVIDTGGTELDGPALQHAIQILVPMPDDPETEVGQTIPLSMRANTVNWAARDLAGRVWTISHILVDGSFTMLKTISTVASHRYSGGGKEYAIASAEAMLGDQRGRFIFVRNDDGTTSVSWSPDNHGKGATHRKA